MFDKLQGMEDRYSQLSEKLYDPSVTSDPEEYAAIMKEYTSLTPIAEKYKEYKEQKNAMEEARQMLEEGGLDKDFKEMVEQELEEAKSKIESISEELKILLLPKDPNDDKNVIVEIRGGAGRGRGRSFCRGALPYVFHVCRFQGMENGNYECQRDRAGRI